METVVRRFVENWIAASKPTGPIVEIGSYLVKDQEELANLRGLFKDCCYIGCDLRPGPGVDLIQDAHCLGFRDGYAGAVLMLETLEHVRDPRKAVAEALRILQAGGTFLASSVMDFPIHEFPCDYWRFTPFGMQELGSLFETSAVYYDGPTDKPRHVFLAATKGPLTAEFQNTQNIIPANVPEVHIWR
jgi:SAM-dependent methyltransferase